MNKLVVKSLCKNALSESDCKVLRGISMLCIVAHNYCHWLPDMTQENEFQWKISNVQAFLNSLATSDGCCLSMCLFSFFGHYGVPVFLFLSAYGLEQKYGNGMSVRGGVGGFAVRHYCKLWKMMAPGFLVAFALSLWMIVPPHDFSMPEFAAMLGMAGNLFPDPSAVIWPGPYWYFGVMLQLYVVYRFFVFRHSLSWTLSLIALCVCVQMFLIPDGGVMRWYRYNFFGSFLPFGMGVVFARQEKRVANLLQSTLWLYVGFIVLMSLVILSGFNFFTWTFTPAFVCLLAVVLVKLLPRRLRVVFEWVGGISAALFVWHPIVRSVVIVSGLDQTVGFLLYLTLSIVLSWLITHKFGNVALVDECNNKNS